MFIYKDVEPFTLFIFCLCKWFEPILRDSYFDRTFEYIRGVSAKTHDFGGDNRFNKINWYFLKYDYFYN